MSQKELQEKVMAYRILESRLDSLAKQREFILGKILELSSTLQSIDEISKAKESIIFPIGGDAYTFADVANKNRLIVGIGAGITLEKTAAEGKEILNERKTQLESAMHEIDKAIGEANAAISELAPEIQGLMATEGG